MVELVSTAVAACGCRVPNSKTKNTNNKRINSPSFMSLSRSKDLIFLQAKFSKVVWFYTYVVTIPVYWSSARGMSELKEKAQSMSGLKVFSRKGITFPCSGHE
ncbi:hypothetical protein GCM10011356_09650 [Kangiella profundi]|nr:hypothetical protein GCM10011356_09650 [Kangiella profundi]